MADISGAVGRLIRSDMMPRSAVDGEVRGPLTRMTHIGPAVRGPLITLVVTIGLDLLARHGVPIVHPFAFLLLSVVYAAGIGGLRPGLVSAAISIVYAVHFLSAPGTMLWYTPAHMYALVSLVLLMPAAAIIVDRLRAATLRAQSAALTREEAMALDRRLSFFAEVNALLASSLDYETSLRSLAKISVPTLGDWCAIHLITEQGAAQFVAGAHRDPTRDLVVRTLCEYDTKWLPYERHSVTARIIDVTEPMLRQAARDEEHLKLYRALATSAVIAAPMRARGRIVGMITVGIGGKNQRSYDADDLQNVEELASRAALAVDNARLYREAEGATARSLMLFEGNPQPMWVFDTDDLTFLAVNDAAVREYGYSRDEFLEMTVIDLRPPEDAPGLMPSLEPSGVRRGEVALAQHQRRDGSIVDMELVSHELELNRRPARLVLATNVTDRARTLAALRRSEEQLRRVQRMDAVGRLAGGVAHDFNNLLTTIRGFSDLLLQDLSPSEAAYKDVEQIRKAADRGVQLTRQLLAFGQRQALHPRPLELNALIVAIEPLVRRLLGADIQFVAQLQRNAGRVFMDPGQLEQVLVNLVLNARDAMSLGGTLTIETYERQIARTGRARNLRPGDYVVLSVSDSGSGMDSESLQHLFEPFYTTQREGQRAGLGLAIAYGIVRQSGGGIRVASETDHGTTIKVYLPRFGDEEPAAALVPRELRGSETVLIVEDEDGVRNLLRKILIEHGHEVLEACHGRDALLAAEAHPEPIDLLVTDVVMPEMGGGPLAEELVARRPGLKVLFISGYTSDEVLRRGVSHTPAAFIQKPFTADDLMKKVRALLD